MTLTHLAGFLVLGGIAGRCIFALPLWPALLIGACPAIALLRPPPGA